MTLSLITHSTASPSSSVSLTSLRTLRAARTRMMGNGMPWRLLACHLLDSLFPNPHFIEREGYNNGVKKIESSPHLTNNAAGGGAFVSAQSGRSSFISLAHFLHCAGDGPQECKECKGMERVKRSESRAGAFIPAWTSLGRLGTQGSCPTFLSLAPKGALRYVNRI